MVRAARKPGIESSLQAARDPPRDGCGVELSPGHLGCKGCGAALAMRFTLESLGPRIVLVVPACCMAVIDGPAPFHAFHVPMLHCAFAATASVATGVRAGLDRRGINDVTVVGFAGDGGTFDIGLQSLSGAAERNENILYICYDNEAYMNTGAQRSSATPELATTTTTPRSHPKQGRKKRIAQIMAAHGIPYIASASVAFPDDFAAKLHSARDLPGFRFLHVLAPCPTGWGSPSDMTVRLAALAVHTRVFPLFEVRSGTSWTVTHPSRGEPVSTYLRMQKRFAHLSDGEVAHVQAQVNADWDALQQRARDG